MNTARILKVLALAMDANPTLPIPLTLDNIDLDNITATPHAKRNTAATMYARDTGEVVRYVGNSGVVYDRIDIARYWHPTDIVEAPHAVTVGDLAGVLKDRFGLDVLPEEISNADQPLPDNGTVKIAINDALSPLYTGKVDVVFAKDAGLAGKDGLVYVLGNIIAGSTPVIGYTDNRTDLVEVSIDGSVWQPVTPVLVSDGLYAISSPISLQQSTAIVRIRGTKPTLTDFDGGFVPMVKLIQYKSFINATAFCAGITTLTDIDPFAFRERDELTSADYLFDGCVNLTTLPDHLFSYCPHLVSAKAAFRNTGITTIPASLLESCAKLTDASMLFERCAALRVIPAGLFQSNTALTTLKRCFLGTTGVVDEIPQGLLDTLVNLEDASYLFAACPWVTTLPNNLLSKCTQLKDITGMFSRCVNLMVIPSDLLVGLYVLNRVDRLFEGCTTIASIPPGLFISNINIEYMNYTFASTGILTTPSVMFSYTRRLLSIDYIFSNCVKLNVIPPALLSPLLRLQSANGVWMGCIGITGVAAGSLDGNINLLSVAWMFARTGISTVPPGLFTLCTKITDVTGLFSGSPIQQAQLWFAAMPQLKSADRLFWKCVQLTTVPPTLFQANTKLESVAGTFAGCSALNMVITAVFNPTTPMTAGLKNCAGCFQGVTGLSGAFADLRTTLTSVNWMDATAVQGVVAGCTGLSDYGSVGSIYKTPLPELV